MFVWSDGSFSWSHLWLYVLQTVLVIFVRYESPHCAGHPVGHTELGPSVPGLVDGADYAHAAKRRRFRRDSH